MKKTTFIRLVLITATLAGCNRPMYTQAPYNDEVYQGDAPDSSNSCSMYPYDLPLDYYNWYYSFRPYMELYIRPRLVHSYSGGGFLRSGFGHTSHTATKAGS